MIKRLSVLLLMLAWVTVLRAELRLPAIISDHMVLQQKQSNPIWGWDTPGTKITVSFAGQTYSTTAGCPGFKRGELGAGFAQGREPLEPGHPREILILRMV